jgi:hypothetical protein
MKPQGFQDKEILIERQNYINSTRDVKLEKIRVYVLRDC